MLWRRRSAKPCLMRRFKSKISPVVAIILQVTVVSEGFRDLTRVKQHQLVYGALSQELASEAIHALALSTSCPS